jgi:hypothetical protein
MLLNTYKNEILKEWRGIDIHRFQMAFTRDTYTTVVFADHLVLLVESADAV